MTLVLKNGLVPAIQFQGNSAMLEGAERLAERHSVYFRINPKFPNAALRNPGCLPGTRSELFVEILQLTGLTFADYALDASVAIHPCSAVALGGSDTLMGHAAKFVMQSDVTEQSIRSVVHDAFDALETQIAEKPGIATNLGLRLNL